jgi:DNA-binding NarL/FixJ family response regulator
MLREAHQAWRQSMISHEEEIRMEPIRIVLADDHPIVGAGAHILETVRHLFEDLAPDMLLIEMSIADPLDQATPRCAPSAPAAPRVLLLRGCQNRVLMFGLLADDSTSSLSERDALHMIARALQAPLEDETQTRSQRIVAQGQTEPGPGTADHFTVREIDILQQLATGKSDRAISEQLGISPSTVRYHLQNIYKKMGVQHRSEAIVWAIRAGIAVDAS